MIRTTLFSSLLLSVSVCAQAQPENCEAFTRDNDRMKISTNVSGQEVATYITTSNIGASMSERLASTLGLDIHRDANRYVISSIGGRMPYRYVTDVDINLFGFDTTLDHVAINRDLNSYMTLSLLPFRKLLVQMNFPESQICFYPPDSIDLRESQNIDFDTDSEYGAPVVKVELNEEDEVWLAITPDYRGGLFLAPAIANDLELAPGADDKGYGNTFRDTIDTLQFGPYQMGNISAEVPRPGVQDNLRSRSNVRTGTAIPDGPGFRGRIGIDILKHFILTMDLDRERMHIYAP